MKTVLLIDSSGSRFFQRDKGQWKLSAAPTAKDELWVLFDLPEETLEVFDMPHLFGSDRSSYVERKLLAAFQGSQYRTSLPLSGNLLKPGKMMLNGIVTTKDLESALENLDTTLVGIWGSAALLTLMSRKHVQTDVMLALPSEYQLRIVVMKNRIPVLTRCVQHDAASDTNEILLTRQYLENQRVLERGRPLPLLYLGDSSALGERLTNAGIPLQSPPKAFAPKGESGWRHALFEFLITSPPCQLAPLASRARHFADNLRVLAYLGTVASIATALLINEGEIRGLYDLHERDNTIATDIQRVTAQRDHLAELIKASGADPELVRRATQFETTEISSAPGADDFLQVAASAIASSPTARISDLTFQLLQDPTGACGNGTITQGVPSGNEPAADAALRHAEIQFKIVLPAELTSREKTDARKRILASLKSIKGVNVQQDPLSISRNAVIKGGTGTTDETPDQWCLSIPWKTPPSAPTEKP
ncbi:MAG: hypothetical protein PHQ60_11830 [Sideroxydans sp.]|nr:hypothetical protein [Sideroxydans sp.]